MPGFTIALSDLVNLWIPCVLTNMQKCLEILPVVLNMSWQALHSSFPTKAPSKNDTSESYSWMDLRGEKDGQDQVTMVETEPVSLGVWGLQADLKPRHQWEQH